MAWRRAAGSPLKRQKLKLTTVKAGGSSHRQDFGMQALVQQVRRAAGFRRRYEHGKQGDRYRSGHDQFLRRGDGRYAGQDYRERRRRSHHSVRRGVHQGWGDPRRAAGKASGRDQPREHDLCHQAPDRPPLRRSDRGEGQEARPLQDRQGRQRRCLDRGRGQEIQPEPDQLPHPGENEGDGGSLSWRGRSARPS